MILRPDCGAWLDASTAFQWVRFTERLSPSAWHSGKACARAVYMGCATTEKKPVWLRWSPDLALSMRGEMGWPRARSQSP